MQFFLLFFFFNDTATTEIYTLSLHDALPISDRVALGGLLDGEELLSREQLPEQNPRGVEVGAPVERLAARLLGREIGELAEDDPRRRLLQLERRAREAEVR